MEFSAFPSRHFFFFERFTAQRSYNIGHYSGSASLPRPCLLNSARFSFDKSLLNSRPVRISAILEGNQLLGRCTSSAVTPPDLEHAEIPEHVAIIMDGNSRWAKAKGLPKELGHQHGVQSLQEVVKLSGKWGIKALTVFAFSTENWRRPQEEVDFLMQLIVTVLQSQLETLHRENVRVCFIGDLCRTPPSLQHLISHAKRRTAGNTGLLLNVALSYSGRQDVVQACQAVARKVQAGELVAHEIGEEDIESELSTNWMGTLGSPDLLIRTSGEVRLSNFMLWQMAYTELHFSNVYWPDFREAQFKEAILDFQLRDRRYGGRHKQSSLPPSSALSSHEPSVR